MSLGILLLLLSQSNVLLNSKNLIKLEGEVNNYNINYVIKKITNSESDPLYLYINTNGGDVEAGLKLIHTLESYKNKKNIICIGKLIISMGFSIFQSCKERVILNSSKAMQHQMKIFLDGDIDTIREQFKYIENINQQLNKYESNRLKISEKKYNNLIKNEWWMYGKDILKFNAADKIKSLNCYNKFRKFNCIYI